MLSKKWLVMPRHSSRLGPKHRASASSNVVVVPFLTTDEKNTVVATSSYRGASRAQRNKFDFSNFSACPMISNYQAEIFDHILKGRSRASLEVLHRALLMVANYFTWLSEKHGINISRTREIDLNVTSYVFLFLKHHGGNYRKMNFFRRFFRSIGVAEHDIPLNTFISTATHPGNVLSLEQTVRMYTHFKGEARIVLDRMREFSDYSELGRDPRREQGGRHGDWRLLQNRIFVVLNVIGTEIKPVVSNRDNGLRSALAGLEAFEGAMTLRLNGQHQRKKGLTGHLAYLYPSLRDLLPFVCLLMIKTRFNQSVILGLRLGKYVFRPLALKFRKSESIVQFSAAKFKSVNDVDAEPSFVHSLSLTKPYAHTFQLIKSLEHLTAPLRDELKRKMTELVNIERKTPAEDLYLTKLEKIKDDLFLYYGKGEISSLGLYAELGDRPTLFHTALTNLGFPTSLAALRNSALAYASTFSGTSQSIVSLLGDHKNDRTAKNYRNRKELHARWKALFIEIFELSMSLISARSYSKKNIKAMLRAQGLSLKEVNSVMREGNLTRWGNRCSDPKNPPPGFDVGTEPGGYCVGQSCIDGCPRARWFPDAFDVAATRRGELLARLSEVGFAASSVSVIHGRIERLEAIMSAILKITGEVE
ncbi:MULTISPECIES: hypothetical protein [unclassified Rhizobium]|uniref:hypothetical protein n=1 Tax=unclassified Rhizobium TaxID=2613769 RepID=UPI001AEB2A46|nr:MULTISPECIES: hypothetical protein [unclassified Rhizobium]MBP2461496.1 hypothetical protein [Rhizobium sp. PvP014]MBP2528891.1 hypothetical protein [Rhizobium sp. PvP099]